MAEQKNLCKHSKYLHRYAWILFCVILKPENLNSLLALASCLLTSSKDADVASVGRCNTVCWRCSPLLVLLEHGSRGLTRAACGREPSAAPQHNPWVLCPEHHSVRCTVFASSHVRSATLVFSAGFLLHMCRTHACSFHKQEQIYCFTCNVQRK